MASTADPTQPWFRRWPDLLAQYVADLEAEGWEVGEPLLHDDVEEAAMPVSGLPEPLRRVWLSFGPGTPATPPNVFLAPPGPIEHYYDRNGSLCLPPAAGDPVSRLKAAIDLYQVEPSDQETWAEIGHAAPEPLTNRLPIMEHQFVLLTCDLPEGAWGTFEFSGRADRSSLRGRIGKTASRTTSSVTAESDVLARNLATAMGPADHRTGVWVRISRRVFPLSPADLWTLARTALPSDGWKLSNDLNLSIFPQSITGLDLPNIDLLGLIVPEEDTTRGEWGERFLLLVARNHLDPIRGIRVSVTPASVVGREFARLPGLESLTERTVAVAGIGMLGAPIAETLARSGTGELRLLDRSVVKAGNLVRQAYDVRDLGRPKVRALRDRFMREAPWCDVPPEHTLHLDAFTPRKTLVRWLEGADLLVLALANNDANLYLADVASDLGIPLVVGWVTYGIWGGIVFSTRWGHTGCPNCLEFDRSLEAAPAAPGDPDGLWVTGCMDPTFPGDAANGSVISAVMNRFAVLGVVTVSSHAFG